MRFFYLVVRMGPLLQAVLHVEPDDLMIILDWKTGGHPRNNHSNEGFNDRKRIRMR